jgi:hypothetical protein
MNIRFLALAQAEINAKLGARLEEIRELLE